jgi:hypothetical protein
VIEPTDGRPYRDAYGVVWTPVHGSWFGDIGGTGGLVRRTWGELESRGPLEVAS